VTASPDILVVVPTYNERDNVAPLIRSVRALPLPLDVAIVDDRSPDGTAAVVEELARADARVTLLAQPGRMGYGRSVLTGFRHALEKGYRMAVTMDADFSHDPRYLPDLVSAIDSGADLAVGSRYVRGVSVVNWPLARLMLSVFANRYVRTITGLPLTDCTSGYRAIRRAVLEAIDLSTIHSNGYSFISEVNYRAHRRSFRLVEVPIIFVERRDGESKMSPWVILEAAFMPWRLRLGL
jgi:dolichol-phosphate mannosyltransferase